LIIKPNILVTSYYDTASTQRALDRLASIATVRRPVLSEFSSEDRFISALQGVQIAVVSGEVCDERVFKSLPHLRMIACDGVGVDHIDLPAATRHGVIVTNAPAVHDANGDFVMGMIIAMVRKMLIADEGVRSGKWHDRSRYVSRDVCGSTLGLLGFGRVAQAVARRARGFDMPILAYSPRASQTAARELGVTLVSFQELLTSADIFSIHVTLNDQTRGMIGEREIAQMKQGAYLVNSSRGAVISERALVNALKDGRLTGAALDVFADEPPPLDHPLLAMDNVVLSPHVGSDTFGTFARVFECLVDDVLLFLGGKIPRHVVNPDVLNSLNPSR